MQSHTVEAIGTLCPSPRLPAYVAPAGRTAIELGLSLTEQASCTPILRFARQAMAMADGESRSNPPPWSAPVPKSCPFSCPPYFTSPSLNYTSLTICRDAHSPI